MRLMRQALLAGPEKIEVREVPLPEPGPGEVLVRVRACGVCASEVHKWRGAYGRFPDLLGHEPAGEVAGLGEGVAGWRAGDRVAGLCQGAMAEYAVARADRLARLPDELPFREGLGEPLACVMSGMWRTGIGLGDRAAVVGLGFMGLLSLVVARLKGPALLVGIDPRPDMRELALALGADEVYPPELVPAAYRVRGWDEFDRGLDAAVEASGTQAGLDLAGEIPGLHGILSIAGWHTGGARRVDMDLWNIKALTVINAHERREERMMEAMRAALALLTKRRFSMQPLVTNAYSLDQADLAFGDLVRKPAGFVKAVIEP